MEIALIILGGLFYRIRGGLLDKRVGKILRKPSGWEINNTIICGLWGIFVALILPITWATPLLALVVCATAKVGYLKQVAEYFKFASGFDLQRKENRTWQNYALLSVRGVLICLPAYLCFQSIYPQLLGGVLAGALMPVCYLIGLRLPEIKGRISHSQWGEWLIGASVVMGVLC